MHGNRHIRIHLGLQVGPLDLGIDEPRRIDHVDLPAPRQRGWLHHPAQNRLDVTCGVEFVGFHVIEPLSDSAYDRV
jgi:hypothetical protein